MTEVFIKKKAKEELLKCGWHAWFPPRVKYYENDIFGVFDCVAISNLGAPFFIQITDITNMSHRIRKVQSFIFQRKAHILAYVWAYDKKTDSFKKVSIEKCACDVT